MTKFIAGTIFGIVIATVGFQGMATLADKGVKDAQVVLQEQVKQAQK